MANPPKIKIPGIGSIPSGFMLGRTAPGIGDVELLTHTQVAQAVASTGVVTKPGDMSATIITMTQPAAGLTITPSSGMSFTFALANDLAALEAMSGTGIVTRTASETYAQRTIVVTASKGLSISNGDGIAGNPTLAELEPTLPDTFNNRVEKICIGRVGAVGACCEVLSGDTAVSGNQTKATGGLCASQEWQEREAKNKECCDLLHDAQSSIGHAGKVNSG